MKKLLATSAVVSLLLLATDIAAQPLQTGFFLDNYIYSYQFNPASMPDDTKGFFGIAIDNLNIGVNSNVGLSSFLFPVEENGVRKLVTGFNSAVSPSVFLGGLNDVIRLNADISENIFSFGCAGKRSFFTLEANLKAQAGTRCPKDMVSLLKIGATEPGVYAINDLTADITAYLELAAGYSYKVNDNLNIGGRLKLLAGLADMSVNIAKVQADVNEEIALRGNGSLDLHALNQDIPLTSEGKIDFDNFDFDKFGVGGFGAALDFGVEYSLPSVEGLTLSASVTDLGGISWKNGCRGVVNYDEVITGDTESFDFEEMFTVESSGNTDFVSICPKFNAGARYQVLRMLSVGALATVCTGRFSWSEARLGATFTPGKVFSLAASAGVNTFGTSVGAALSLKIPGFNLYLGTDSIITEVTPEYVPVNKVHTRLNLGLAIAF